MKQWILQDKNFALGNFINVTPVIKYLFNHNNEPVDVFFETEYVKECYINNKYINILTEKPTTEPFASSSMINRKNDKPDYEYAFELTTGHKYNNHFKPFINKYFNNDLCNYVLIMNGTGNQDINYTSLKDPGIEPYIKLIYKYKMGLPSDFKIIFTGTIDDYMRVEGIHHLFDEYYLNDITKSLELITNAAYIITNDTGTAHAAGTMDKNMLVLWKDTKFIKNKNSGINTTYLQKEQWMNL